MRAELKYDEQCNSEECIQNVLINNLTGNSAFRNGRLFCNVFCCHLAHTHHARTHTFANLINGLSLSKQKKYDKEEEEKIKLERNARSNEICSDVGHFYLQLFHCRLLMEENWNLLKLLYAIPHVWWLLLLLLLFSYWNAVFCSHVTK